MYLTDNGGSLSLTPPKKTNEQFLSPGDADADYRLLANSIPVKDPYTVARSDVTSAQCYLQDDSVQLNRAGDYSQRTNNYLRTYPDSCSAPRHEFLLGFYNEPNGKPIQAIAPLC